MIDKCLLSTGKDEWETPLDFFNQLDSEFHFTLDPCCTEKNAKCKKFYTKDDDGLKQTWKGEVVFINPPYSKKTKLIRDKKRGLKKPTKNQRTQLASCSFLHELIQKLFINTYTEKQKLDF